MRLLEEGARFSISRTDSFEPTQLKRTWITHLLPPGHEVCSTTEHHRRRRFARQPCRDQTSRDSGSGVIAHHIGTQNEAPGRYFSTRGTDAVLLVRDFRLTFLREGGHASLSVFGGEQ